jgi:hypothetical protein
MILIVSYSNSDLEDSIVPINTLFGEELNTALGCPSSISIQLAARF